MATNSNTGRTIGSASSGHIRPNLSASVVLVEPDRPSARAIRRILLSTVGQVEVCVRHDEVQSAGRDNVDVLIVNYDQAGFDALASLAQKCAGRTRVLLYGTDITRGELADLLEYHGVTNLLAHHGRSLDDQLLVTVRKLLSDDIFGLDKYFPWGARRRDLTVTGSAGIVRVVDAAEYFARRLGASRRTVGRFGLVAEELVSNALYKAPIDATGDRLFSDRQRTQRVDLPEPTNVEVCLCSDGRRIGLSVSDPFGSLTADRIVADLARGLRMGAGQTNTPKRTFSRTDQDRPNSFDRPLGLYEAFEGLSHFAINLAAGRRTEAAGLIDIRGAAAEPSRRAKSFNIFVAS